MLRSMILEELSLSQTIVRTGEEVVPRFRILAPEGEFSIFLPLPNETTLRLDRLDLIRHVMIWKLATGFVHASELVEPDAIVVLAVTRKDIAGGLQRIRRKPVSFGETEWFGRAAVGDELLALLPSPVETLSEEECRFVERALAGDLPGIRWVGPGETM